MSQEPSGPQADEVGRRRVPRGTALALLAAVVAVVTLVAGGLHARLQPVPHEPARPLAVETRLLQPEAFIRVLDATGSVEAERRAVLSAQLPARVVEAPFREGDQVTRGSVLVRLDATEQQHDLGRREAAVDRVATDLSFWRQELDTDRKLWAGRAISRRELEETESRVANLAAALEEARQAAESARARMDYALVRAPYDGYVHGVRTLPGESVQPGTPMLEILAAQPLKVVVSVAETDLAAIRQGQAARIHVPAVAGAWDASIDRVHPGLEPGTRSAMVELFLPAAVVGLRPGMAAEVDIVLDRSDDVLVVPQQSLHRRDGKSGVYVLVDGVARWRPVRPGAGQAGRVPVLDGLESGDELITTPHPQLRDGRAVRARNDWRG